MECTLNRVGDTYFDQIQRSGHADRAEDLDRFAELGIRTLRYPILWERTAPHGLEHIDWRWADSRLKRLRRLEISPIVGFVHHGSGPRHTSLVSSCFPEKLAQFAAAFAERFPWVQSYTPVNEPLTTARFSGLYGVWYPHGSDAYTFARAVLIQCRATVLAMRAIRRVNPAAQLVQTDDLGKSFSTPALAYQAEFENERRWLSWDLLCGRVNRDHPMWGYLRWAGIEEPELEFFLEHPCPPDIIGINHYLTSERFLDERIDRYPPHTHGSNGTHSYADVEAVRVRPQGIAGPGAMIRETWERFGLPVAVTEAHLGCSREEQLRWLGEVWSAACEARAEGVDVRAVTAWALLGSFDWHCLLTREEGHYEPGVFDLRAPQPRPTALAHMLRNLATRGEHDHPVLDGPGWWRRPERILYPLRRVRVAHREPGPDAARPLLITGATGTLGQAFARICDLRGLSHRLLTRQEMDIADPASVEAALDRTQPWAVINAAGYVRVDDAEREPEVCMRENTGGPTTLAAACARHDVKLVAFSSDLVFDGEQDTPYLESDPVSPLGVYGRSKAEMEARVLELLPSSLVVRTSAFFGPWDPYNFATLVLRVLHAGDTFVAADDAVVSPTYVPDLAHAALDLLIDGEQGIWHLANPGAITWADLARTVAEMAGLDTFRIEARPTRELGLLAPRPLFSALGSERGSLLPSLSHSLHRYFHDRGLPVAEGIELALLSR